MSVRIGDVPKETDVVVIGSGFGGSVVAEKLAANDLRVCVLERGKAYPPGSFPRTPGGVATNFWDPSKGLHGLFDAWSFDGLETIVSSGLGGGSLIYANVMVRKPAAWFQQPHPYRPGVQENWSFSRADLEPHYDAVEQFLDIQKLPTQGGAQPLDPAYLIPKVAQFRHAGTGVGTVEYAPLAVQFRDADGEPMISARVPNQAYPNLFGATRRTCRLCGECDVGCNEGAKNSMDHTYLSAATAHGASLHQRTEVRTITRRGGKFIVGVVVHRPEDEGAQPPVDTRRLPLQYIEAGQVVVSAGALGSSYLLLRNRESLRITNPALGSRFCGNGDMLGFILNVAQDLDGWKGPVITSYLELVEDGHRMVIEDAGYPEFAAWLVETAVALKRLPAASKVLAGLLWSRLRRHDGRISDDISALMGRPTTTTRGMPVLAMGMDVPDGTLYLRRGRDGTPLLDSTWTSQTSKGYFDTVVRRLETLAAAMGGDFMVNPTFRLRRVITVHPLGGCPADTSETRGVVDGFGRVRGVPGLRVCDGSVFPGPVGTNPSLTIAAFADRMATQMLSGAAGSGSWPTVVGE